MGRSAVVAKEVCLAASALSGLFLGRRMLLTNAIKRKLSKFVLFRVTQNLIRLYTVSEGLQRVRNLCNVA